MSSHNTFGNFTMFAKDQDSANALIDLKVQDNSDPDVCKAVRSDLWKLRTFRMEFDIGTRMGKLPSCFARQFGLQVAPFVILLDPNGNEFEVKVEKKHGKVYFSDGWAGLKNFYNILAGAWLTIIFANRNLFLLRGFSLYDEEWTYPTFNPPKRFLLKDGSARSPTVACSPTVFFLPTKFKHTIVKELTSSDVTDGRLKLGWLGFCQDALPSEECEIKVVDYLGYMWKCFLKFEFSDDMSCTLSGEWVEICNARKFKEGDLVRIGATDDANNMVLYMTPPQMRILRTRLPPSTSNGGTGYVINVEQYFWNN